MTESERDLNTKNNAQLSESPLSKDTLPENRNLSSGIKNPVGKPTTAQKKYLKEGIDQAGGKLPLFDRQGQLVNSKTIQACVAKGWAEPWFYNPSKPDWLVCKLTEAGRDILHKI